MGLSSSWAFLSPFTFALNPKVSQHIDYGLKHKFAIKRIFTLFFINIVVESVWLWRISGAITGEGVTNLSWKPKLLFWIMCPVSFWFFFFTEGSFTNFNISLASFLFLHASVRLTSGQTPKQATFPFPLTGTSSSSSCSHYDAGAGKGTPINDRLGRVDFIFCTKSY